MALQDLAGSGLLFPMFRDINGGPGYTATAWGPVDANTEKIAFNGRVWFPARTGTKSIQYIGFRFGTNVSDGSSRIDVSMQDVSLTSGPPMQPDGNKDQVINMAVDVSNAWEWIGPYNPTRTVSYGDRLSIVFEFDTNGRQGSDSFHLAGLATGGGSTGTLTGDCIGCFYNGSTWTAGAYFPNVLLGFSDGSFGILDGSLVFSTTGVAGINSSSTPDEVGCRFSLPFPCKVDGIWACIDADADLDVVLYNDTTELTSAAIDANALQASSGKRFIIPIAPQTLAANTDYIIALRPTTTTQISYYTIEVANASHWAVHEGGSFAFTSRTNAGSWAASTTTKRIFMGVRISALDDGATQGGGNIFPIFD